MSSLKVVYLDLSELEAMRLCDHEGFDQSTAGREMGVSRATIQRLLAGGRAKVLETLIHNRALRIREEASHEDLYSQPGRSGTEQ